MGFDSKGMISNFI